MKRAIALILSAVWSLLRSPVPGWLYLPRHNTTTMLTSPSQHNNNFDQLEVADVVSCCVFKKYAAKDTVAFSLLVLFSECSIQFWWEKCRMHSVTQAKKRGQVLSAVVKSRTEAPSAISSQIRPWFNNKNSERPNSSPTLKWVRIQVGELYHGEITLPSLRTFQIFAIFLLKSPFRYLRN